MGIFDFWRKEKKTVTDQASQEETLLTGQARRKQEYVPIFKMDFAWPEDNKTVVLQIRTITHPVSCINFTRQGISVRSTDFIIPRPA